MEVAVSSPDACKWCLVGATILSCGSRVDREVWTPGPYLAERDAYGALMRVHGDYTGKTLPMIQDRMTHPEVIDWIDRALFMLRYDQVGEYLIEVKRGGGR
jgi:hypothetical protein